MQIGRRFSVQAGFQPDFNNPINIGFAYSAGARARSTSGIHQRISADAFSVAVSIWAAIYGSTARTEPDAIPSEMSDANRSLTRFEASTMRPRIDSGSAVSADVRSSGPRC